MRVTKKAALVGLLLVVMSGSNIALGQKAKLPGGPGLMAYAPKDTVFFLERQGHAAIKKAFDASNVGKMAKDDAMNGFIHGTRVRIGEMIVRGMFRLKNPVSIQAHQKTLHEVLKPFWHQPSAMVVTVAKSGPEFYFICQAGEYKKTCRHALEKLMSIGVSPLGTAGERQAFAYNSSGIAWEGVAKSWNKFQLSNDPVKLPGELRGKTVFMTAWQGNTVCVAMSLAAADRASTLLAKPDPARSILANESVARIAAKTHIKEWAFRWHVNLEPVFELAGDEMGPQSTPGRFMASLGLDSIRGIGGTGGYLDNVYTRMTYADAPNSGGLFKHGGDYTKALAMVPQGAAISLAGQFNASWIGDAVSYAATGGNPPPADQKAPEIPVVKEFKALLANSEGNGTVFLTSIQAIAGMMTGRGGPPIGFIMDIKDHAKAVKSLDKLVKLSGAAEKGTKPPKPYRKIKIIQTGGMMKMALTKDRLVVAMNQSAMTAAIDTLLDGAGGLGKDSKAAKLVKLAGDGSAVFHLDLAEVVKVVWPFLVAAGQKAVEDGDEGDFPLTSIPSAGKMARMLGPEIAVFKPDSGGLLMKSRGTIPLITKILPTFPVTGGGFFFLMMMR